MRGAPTMLRATRSVTILLGLAATASAQPADPAAKGFVELGLGFGYAMSNAPFVEVDRGTLLASPRSRGAAIDVAGGYAFVPNLAVFADLQYAGLTSRTGQNEDGDTEETSVGYSSLGLGLRATVPVGPGQFYAQMALGVVLPFETEGEQRQAGGDTRITTIGYNAGLGGRGEMGYHYPLNERMYLTGGLRLQAFATDNVGRERVRRDEPSGMVERETYTTDPNANNSREAEALSLQDMRLRIGFGLRF